MYFKILFVYLYFYFTIYRVFSRFFDVALNYLRCCTLFDGINMNLLYRLDLLFTSNIYNSNLTNLELKDRIRSTRLLLRVCRL